MPNTKVTKKTLNVIQGSFNSLKHQEPLYPVDIYRWLTDNINAACSAVAGDPGRPLSGSGGYTNQVELNKNKLVASLAGSWDYKNKTAAPPQIDNLKSTFEGITFKAARTNPTGPTFKALCTIDLEQWPTLVMTMLWQHLSVAFGKDARDWQQPEALEKAQLLLLHFYPGTSLDTFKIAGELGMLDEVTSFISWFKTHVRPVHDLPTITTDSLNDLC